MFRPNEWRRGLSGLLGRSDNAFHPKRYSPTVVHFSSVGVAISAASSRIAISRARYRRPVCFGGACFSIRTLCAPPNASTEVKAVYQPGPSPHT